MSSYYNDKIEMSKNLSNTVANTSGVSRILVFCDDNLLYSVSDIITYSPSTAEINNIGNTTYDDKNVALTAPHVLYFAKEMYINPVINNPIINGIDATGGIIVSNPKPDLIFNDSVVTIQFEHKDTSAYILVTGSNLISKIQSFNVTSVTTKEFYTVGATGISELISGKSSVYHNYLIKEHLPIPMYREM